MEAEEIEKNLETYNLELQVNDMVKYIFTKKKEEIRQEMREVRQKRAKYESKKFLSKMRARIPRILKKIDPKFFDKPRDTVYTYWRPLEKTKKNGRPTSELFLYSSFLFPQMIVCARRKRIFVDIKIIKVPKKIIDRERRDYDLNQIKIKHWLSEERRLERQLNKLDRNEKKIHLEITDQILESTEEGKKLKQQLNEVQLSKSRLNNGK